jgi:hypothetical protein
MVGGSWPTRMCRRSVDRTRIGEEVIGELLPPFSPRQDLLWSSAGLEIEIHRMGLRSYSGRGNFVEKLRSRSRAAVERACDSRPRNSP